MNISSKQLTNLNKFKKASLPILELAMITSKTILVHSMQFNCNCHTQYEVKHGLEVKGICFIPVADFVKIARKHKITSIEQTGKKYSVHTEAGTFTFPGIDADDYISYLTVEAKTRAHEVHSDILKRLNDYTSTDDLRPAMMGVYVSDEYAATDGHRLEWIDRKDPLEEPEIIPRGVINLLVDSSYTLYQGDENSKLVSCNNSQEIVTWQRINEKYPNYRSVIPQFDKDNHTVLDKKEALKALNAAKISSPYSKQIRLKMNGTVTLYAFDLDLNKEFKSNNIGTYSRDENFEIAFNAELLEEALKRQPDQTVKVTFSVPTKISQVNNKPALIGKHEMLMPVMIHSYN